MNVNGKPTRTIWRGRDGAVEIIDQTALPHAFVVRPLHTVAEVAHAIASMQVRGAPLIGAAAAYGLWLAMRADASDGALAAARAALAATRPTAVNLRWALDADGGAAWRRCRPTRVRPRRAPPPTRSPTTTSRSTARSAPTRTPSSARPARGAAPASRCRCSRTATPGGWRRSTGGRRWRASTPRTTRALPVHVWVDETRPRNQGAALTAWELGAHGVPHTVIVDNAGGHLMQRGQVDVVLVGTDRTTAAGDVVNKIGTYLKALAARDCGVPFYVAAPSPSIDWTIRGAPDGIPIEERAADEVTTVVGAAASGATTRVRIAPDGQPRAQPGLRRHARAPGHRHRHRARRRGGVARRAGAPVPGARRATPAEGGAR